MKAYLCLESDAEAVEVASLPKGATERKSLYFVMKAENWEKATEKAKGMGARVIRVLTKEEMATEAKEGSYDIRL